MLFISKWIIIMIIKLKRKYEINGQPRKAQTKCGQCGKNGMMNSSEECKQNKNAAD